MKLPKLDVWVLSASESLCVDVNLALAESGLSGIWKIQPVAIGNYQLRVSKNSNELDTTTLASKLQRIGVIAELELPVRGGFQRYLVHPALGVCRQELDEAGEVLLRSGAVQALLEQSVGSAFEFKRLLRKLDGTLWLDLLEPYRQSSQKITLLNRVG